MSYGPNYSFAAAVNAGTLNSEPVRAHPGLVNYLLGLRAVGWFESSIDEWIRSRVELSSKVEV